jgi:hypothetical protein
MSSTPSNAATRNAVLTAITSSNESYSAITARAPQGSSLMKR